MLKNSLVSRARAMQVRKKSTLERLGKSYSIKNIFESTNLIKINNREIKVNNGKESDKNAHINGIHINTRRNIMQDSSYFSEGY